MATTLQIESFPAINLGERAALSEPAQAADESLAIRTTEGYAVGDIIYVGELSREGCEKAVVASVTEPSALGLVDALELPHAVFEPVTAVLGDRIKIYRAANVDGAVPADDAFSVLTTREIDPDQLSTYYRDPDGSSQYWYRWTYLNQDTSAETSLQDATPVRGDDFGHYASISQIRTEAGFTNALNLKDNDVDQQRRAAESEINATLSSAYTTPFNPVPAIINTLTIKLAAAMLLVWAFGATAANQKRLTDARAAIQAYADGDSSIPDEDGNSTSTATIGYYPTDEQSRMFTVDQRF